MNKSDQLEKLGEALAKAQGQIQAARKDSNNQFFKSTYADLASVWEACRIPLTENGLSVIQCIEFKDGKRCLETMLLHSSGQFINSTLDLSCKDETMQAIGSAITYARRYSLAAIVGVCADEDDDGEGAMGRGTTPKPAQVKPQPKPENNGNEHYCHIHKEPFKEFTKGNQKWYSHKLPDGTYCNESKIKKVESQDEAFEKLGRTEQEKEGVPGSDEWIKRKVSELNVDVDGFLKYINMYNHIPVEATLEKTLKRLEDAERAEIARLISEKEKAIKVKV